MTTEESNASEVTTTASITFRVQTDDPPVYQWEGDVSGFVQSPGPTPEEPDGQMVRILVGDATGSIIHWCQWNGEVWAQGHSRVPGVPFPVWARERIKSPDPEHDSSIWTYAGLVGDVTVELIRETAPLATVRASAP